MLTINSVNKFGMCRATDGQNENMLARSIICRSDMNDNRSRYRVTVNAGGCANATPHVNGLHDASFPVISVPWFIV